MLAVEITIKKKVSFLKIIVYLQTMIWLPSHHTTTSYVSPTIATLAELLLKAMLFHFCVGSCTCEFLEFGLVS